ncbi:MAG: molybdopterin molybdotransferase MoeA, partial [Hyphomicrobiaceae bacterium]|nr:molybdopterin molybdotransferase MoeA [Hyphomicrobiaceae bacterium]
PARLTVIGTAAAGHPFAGRVEGGEAVRIFTGAPVPEGADAIVIQENTARDGATLIVREGAVEAELLRPRGMDFHEGATLIEAGRRLGPGEIALTAAMGHSTLAVRRRPRIAVLSTGDELVAPGVRPGAGQIVASSHLAVGALAEAAGAEVRQLGIAGDDGDDLARHFAEAAGADILVTTGGVSVGDHDLVAPALLALGMTLAFWKIAMRPGKPLMYGRLGRTPEATRVLGLPGNPAASFVCARLFLVPLIWRLCGRPVEASLNTVQARLGTDVEDNGPRQHYMRAVLRPGSDGRAEVVPFPLQDSSLIVPLAQADCLLVRPPNAPAAAAGSSVRILRLEV